MRHFHSYGLAGWLFLLLISGCQTMPDPWAKAKPGQKRVLVSFPPLYALTQAVAGDDAYVLCLLTTIGPHDYHDSPSDMIKLKKADLVLSNGLELDDLFMSRMLGGSGNRSAALVKVADLLPENMLLHSADHDPAKGDKHAHRHGDFDPHVWLGPPEAQALAKIIGDQLAKVDPDHAANYQKRVETLNAELGKLQEDGKKLLAAKKNRKILSMHESLGYFARAFDLDIVGSVQEKAGVDPDPARLAGLVELCRQKDVHVLTVEPQYGHGLPDALQRQLEAHGHAMRKVEIDPLETANAGADGNPPADFYFRAMRRNLTTLAEALP